MADRTEIYALDEGDFVIRCPSDLSPASYQDLADYIAIFLSKAKRRARDRAVAGDLEIASWGGHA